MNDTQTTKRIPVIVNEDTFNKLQEILAPSHMSFAQWVRNKMIEEIVESTQ